MKKNTLKNLLFIFLSMILIHFCGCAYHKPLKQKSIKKISEIGKVTGVYHKVNTGETLWGIARVYNVNIEEIVKINRIPNSARIEKDQLIFIPRITENLPSDSVKTDLKNKKFIWPVKGEVISYFGNIDDNRKNKGIDVKINPNTIIIASRAGKVVFSDEFKGYGKTIIIDHLDGFFSIYSNNQKLLVSLNDNIYQGQQIAKFESSEKPYSSIHFEIRESYQPANPLYYLP